MQAVALEKSIGEHQDKLKKLNTELNNVLLGKQKEIELSLACILAQGHLLIEDRPGMGKSTLVKTLAKLLGLQSNRVQFTNDLLPADIIGTSIFKQATGEFELHKGPLFTQVFFADELNRATPKTQSACLQAMEESEVSLDGKTYPLVEPFFVIATQNPQQNIGTYPLPESQLDRFLMRIELGYPDRASEKELLMGQARHSLIEEINFSLSSQEILDLQTLVHQVHCSETLVEYVQDLCEESRVSSTQGVSPRGALGLIQASKAWALLQSRHFVAPEDVQAVAVSVMGHRVCAPDETHAEGRDKVLDLIERVPVRE